MSAHGSDILGVPVHFMSTCWCSRVSDMRGREKRKSRGGMERERERARREREREEEEEEILQPCPLIVFGVRGSSPALREYPLIPRDRGKENHPASVRHLHSCLPPMLYSIPQTQSQITTGAPHSSPSPHFDQLPSLPSTRLLMIDVSSCCTVTLLFILSI